MSAFVYNLLQNNLPHSISHIDSKIELENATIASATQELKNLEIESNSLENEINSLSEQIVRQKNKQLEVKKNEEYQASLVKRSFECWGNVMLLLWIEYNSISPSYSIGV